MNRYILKDIKQSFTYNKKLREKEYLYVVDDPHSVIHDDKNLYNVNLLNEESLSKGFPSKLKIFGIRSNCIDYCVDKWYDNIYKTQNYIRQYWKKTRSESKEELNNLLSHSGDIVTAFPINYFEINNGRKEWTRLASTIRIHKIEKIHYI